MNDLVLLLAYLLAWVVAIWGTKVSYWVLCVWRVKEDES